MTKPSHQVTIYPNSPEIHSIQIQPHVDSGVNKARTSVEITANDQNTVGVVVFALQTIRDLQNKMNDHTGMIYNIAFGVNTIQFVMSSIYKTSTKVGDIVVNIEDAKCDAKRIFRLIEEYSNVRMPELDLEQAIDKAFASLEMGGEQSSYQSGLTKFNPAPTDKSDDDQPRYKHEYCFMK